MKPEQRLEMAIDQVAKEFEAAMGKAKEANPDGSHQDILLTAMLMLLALERANRGIPFP